jgi:hypothetical protein
MSTIKVDTINDASGGSAAVLYGVASPPNSMGFRNRLINGGFKIWQRGTSFTSTAAPAYVADRWRVASAGANQSVVQDGTYPNYTLNILGASGNTYSLINQRIEAANCFDLAGVKVTISGRMYTAGSGLPASVALYYAGSADNFGTETLIESFTLTTTANGYTDFSFTTSAVLPSQVANGLAVYFNFTSGIPLGSAVAFVTMQLEAGTVASPFERRDYGRELMMCQRYYTKTYPDANVPGSTVSGQQQANSIWSSVPATNSYPQIGQWSYPVTMRATPTIVIYNPNTGVVNSFIGDSTSYSPAVANSVGNKCVTFFGSNVSVGTNTFVSVQATASAEL